MGSLVESSSPRHNFLLQHVRTSGIDFSCTIAKMTFVAILLLVACIAFHDASAQYMGNMWNMGMGNWNGRMMGNMMGNNYNNYGMGSNGYMNRMSSNNNWNNQWRNGGWNSNNFGMGNMNGMNNMMNMNMDRKHPQTTYNDADF